MASEFDQSDFVDSDFQAAQKARGARQSAAPSAASNIAGRPPTREELDVKVSETQQRLVELKRAQEALERERAALEEARRRQSEFQSGREEMLKHLIRGVGLLTEAEFAARRDAEQMSKTLIGLRDAQAKVQDINTEIWTTENYNTELTRALATIENARMEWNSALLKWTLLSGASTGAEAPSASGGKSPLKLLEGLSFKELCKLGLALSWPLTVAALLALVMIAVLLFRR